MAKAEGINCLGDLMYWGAFIGGLSADSEPPKVLAAGLLVALALLRYLLGPLGTRPESEWVWNGKPGFANAIMRLSEAALAPINHLLSKAVRAEAWHTLLWKMFLIQVGVVTLVVGLRPLYFALAFAALVVCQLALAERRIEDLRTVLTRRSYE